MPLPTDSDTFSAISRQHTTLKKEVRSSHSLVWRFIHRRFTARPNVAFGCPPEVYRISGSRVTLPTTVTVLSAMSPLLVRVRAGPGSQASAGVAAGDPAVFGGP